VAIDKINEIKQRIRDALGSEPFQAAAAGLRGSDLATAVVALFKKNSIRVSLISVGVAEPAALADYVMVWRASVAEKPQTSWFSLKPARR